MVRGFTLIETAMAIVIAVIIAIVVLSSWGPLERIRLDAAARKVVSDIRYAQKLAVSTQGRAAFVTNSVSTYTVYRNITSFSIANSPGDPCSGGAGGKFVVDFTNSRCNEYLGVNITAGVTVAFDKRGTPTDTAGVQIGTTTLNVTHKGNSKTVTIYGGTGKVSY